MLSNEDANDMLRHTMMFGEGAICRKLGTRWTVEWRGHGFPTVFRTKTAACAKAREWVQTVRARLRTAA